MENAEKKSIESLKTTIGNMGGIAQGPKTKIGLVKWLYSEILKTRNSGFSLAEILQTLKNSGFDSGFKETTLNHFYGLVHRVNIEFGHDGKSRTNASNLPGAASSPPQADLKRNDEETPENKNPLHKLTEKAKPGEHNPVPIAKIQFDD